MAHDSNPLSDQLDVETRRRMFNELDYGNMNGTRECVDFPGGGLEVRVKHGFNFTPTLDGLTVRPHLAQADVGMIHVTRDPDASYIYLAAPRAGRVYVEISHPPKSS